GIGNGEQCKRSASGPPGWPKHRDAAFSGIPAAAPDAEYARSFIPCSPFPLLPASRLRPLPLVVLPLQDPPGDEAVHGLAGGEPGFAQPRRALEDAAFDRGDRLRAVRAL